MEWEQQYNRCLQGLRLTEKFNSLALSNGQGKETEAGWRGSVQRMNAIPQGYGIWEGFH
jgi:hypothetical protein